MNFIASILSEDNNQGSFSRVSGALIILALIIWASIITWTTRTIPDVPIYWLYLVLGLYGINKGIDGIKAFSGAIKGENNVPAQPAQ